MKFIIFFFVLSLSEVLFAKVISSEKEFLGEKYKAEKIADGFRVPWGFDFINDEEMLLTERRGRMYRLNIKTSAKQEVSGLPKIASRGQGGLLDVKLDPQFSTNKKIYFSYSVKVNSGGYTTRIASAQLDGQNLKEVQVLFTAQPAFSQSRHFGSRIAFDNEGHLFFSVGDRGNRDLAQSLETDNGKIHRIHRDGRIPLGNPFKDKNGKTKSIWSYGHRNPQGLHFEASSGILWSGEHGPRGGDEINKIQKAKNYGWPIITYGKEYIGGSVGDGLTKKKGMEQPIKYFVPSIAPCGLLVYSGRLFKKWKGSVFSGALVLQHLNVLVLDSGKPKTEHRMFKELRRRIRNVGEDSKGRVYFSSDSGEIFRIVK